MTVAIVAADLRELITLCSDLKILFIRAFAEVHWCNKEISYFSCRRMKKISKDSGFCLILDEKLEITYQRIKELRAGSTEWLHDRIVISIFISIFSVMFL